MQVRNLVQRNQYKQQNMINYSGTNGSGKEEQICVN